MPRTLRLPSYESASTAMSFDGGTPELNRKLLKDPHLLPTAADRELLLRHFRPEDREEIRKRTARRLRQARKIAGSIKAETVRQADKQLQKR